MPDLLANLNPEQLEAVTLPGGQGGSVAPSALILAGAGSGKTKVLTTRIAWLIQTGQVSPAGVLAVTFTNKAAKEMMTRLSAMLPINTRGMWIGTFHGLCNRLLRAHHRDAGLPSTFQILDTQDQLSAIKRLLKSLNVDDEKYPPKQLAHFISHAKESGLRPNAMEAHDDFNRRFIELYAAYDAQCQREGVVDFSELLLRCYEVLLHNVAIREHYQRRFRHILVDEFQDTNKLQYAWLKLLAGLGTPQAAAVFAVGDDDQSIYAFRGADVENMRQFEAQFHPHLVKLEQNYRSHSNILDAANQLIANNSRRLGKNLRTDAGHGEPVRVYEAATDGLEAAWLVEEIRSLIDQGRMRGEIAILYRSNAQSRIIEHALFSAGIPYRVYGGLRFFERAEVKHALAYLRLMENPHDDTAFARIVNFPTRGIGARALEAVQDAARRHNSSLYTAVTQVGGKPGQTLGAFVRLIEQMRFETQQLTLPEIVEHVIHHSTLISHYQTEKEGQERIDNLLELVNAATAFVAEEGYGQNALAKAKPENRVEAAQAGIMAGGPGVGVLAVGDQVFQVLDADNALPTATTEMTPLAAFLAHASLEAGDNQAQAGQDAVQMMTVHAAKGLEFHAVFITGLEEGLFPHENSAADEEGLEEERRLMYVAITRARERLYLSFTQSRLLHGQTRYNLRSRFLEELPDACLKWLTPQVQGGMRWGNRQSPWGRDGLGANQALPWGGQAEDRPAWTVAETAVTKSAKYRVGQSVFHTKFGEGVIVGLEGRGDDARAQINFGRHGLKWLALAVAKLDPIN